MPLLEPAILYKEDIIRKMQERFYTDDMMYETGGIDNWTPCIADCPDETTFQYAVVKDDEVIGYIGFKIDWYVSCAYNFGMISFDKGNVSFGMALDKVMNMLINDFHLHRIEWRMVGGNPVERSYDRFCEKYHGTKHVLQDVIRDKYGKYHDSIIYEIILN